MNKTSSIDDKFLLSLQEKIAIGEQQAFRQLFDLFSEKLSQFALSIVRNKEAAIDVVDEVFVKIWKQRIHVTGIRYIKTYLYTATKNTSLNYLSRKANQLVTEPFDFISIELREDDSPDQQLITAEIFNRIRAAVDHLPPRCKMIFKLVREDGLKYQEVADILNISINTVDAQMVIAVKKISEKVSAHFESFPAVAARKK